MNLQAEIQELRAMRAGVQGDAAIDRSGGTPSAVISKSEPRGGSSQPQTGKSNGDSFSRRAQQATAATVENTNHAKKGSEQDEHDAPRRIVQLITSDTATQQSKNTVKPQAAQSDASLPVGWLRVVHDSGLPCFVNEKSGVVTWTKPYPLASFTSTTELIALAKTHVPPLSIFRQQSRRIEVRHDTGRQSDPDLRAQPSALQAGAVLEHTRKRKADELDSPQGEPVFRVLHSDHAIPLVEVNNVVLGSPEGKSVNAFLREVAAAAWRGVQQYFFTKTDDVDQPYSCTVRINEHTFSPVARSSKPLAKEAAAEAVLEKCVPGYWSKLKAEGIVGKSPFHSNGKQKDEGKKAAEDLGPKITLDEFKQLSIADPRIVQACMELSIKTPAQVIQEYQNRNRGISINYNTIPHEGDTQKLFKTIVTAGSTAAEGIATTKKMAKQYAAQNLLATLHQKTAKTYNEVADLYSSLNKVSKGDSDQKSLTAQIDRGTRASPLKKMRRPSPNQHNGNGGAQGYATNGSGYNHGGGSRGSGWGTYGGGYPSEQGGWQPRSEGSYGRKNERIVEYYTPAASSGTYADYYGAQQGWGYQQQPSQPQLAQYQDYRRPPFPSHDAMPPYAPAPTVLPQRLPYDPRPNAYNRPKMWTEPQDPNHQVHPHM